MPNEKGLSKLGRRLLVVLCTLLLAGGTFLVLGVSVFAQQQPSQQQGNAQQSAQNSGQIDYWEPAVGTRTVYYTEDINDIHGQTFGPVFLGYFDIASLYKDPLWPEPYQLSQSKYYHTQGISNLTPVYFDLTGPWYFSMTTPWKVVEEVKGIDEAPDAGKFPQATYAIKYFIIGSGGTRVWGWEYRSNDSNAKTWTSWGGTVEYFPPGQQYSRKFLGHYNPPVKIVTFPLSVGVTGSIEKSQLEGEGEKVQTESGSYTVVASGKITVPAGTYDSLMIKYDLSPSCRNNTFIEYAWLVQGVGMVTDITSLPNEIGPAFRSATDIEVMESQTGPAPQK
jgi:hypothetical protein